MRVGGGQKIVGRGEVGIHARPGARLGLTASCMVALVGLASCGGVGDEAAFEAAQAEATASAPQTTLIQLWAKGTPAFGVYAPSEREFGARGPNGERLPPLYTAAVGTRLAEDSLIDYVFLNLEGRYDADAVTQIARGLASPTAVGEKTLLVRIPPISADGVEAARARVREALAAGADGIVLPHIRSPDEARTAVGFFEEIDADVWSPSNPDGTVIAMLMLEDPDAVAAAEEVADMPGYSVLACGIGSLRGALGGDREAAEAGNQRVLAEAKRSGHPDMITANADDVAQRIEEGFLALLMSGAEADDHIRVGRAAAGR